MLNLDLLNAAQRAAVMHGEGPLLVLAGPGSGKTHTVTQRILYLIEVMGVMPEEILVVTFTREAAVSMQRRFSEQSDQIYPVNFGTFHSVFYTILRKSCPSRTRQILGENQKKDIIQKILNADGAEHEANHAKELLSAISFYKNTADMEQTLLRFAVGKREEFEAIFSAYVRQTHKLCAIDLDDMVYECVQLLTENSQLRRKWSERFTHILVDEFQDINPIQYRGVGLLSRKPYNLFAVGDDDQAIYGFRGSDSVCMQQFQKDYQAAEILLDMNYRSVPDIVNASLQVIGENRNRFHKKIRSAYEVQEIKAVALHAFTDWEMQTDYLIKRLKQKEEGEICAVLFRTNIQLQRLAIRLNKAGIPYEIKDRAVSLYEHFIVKDIMTYLRLGTGERKREYYLQIINKPRRLISREALESKTDKDFLKLEQQLDYLKKTSLYLGIQYICKVMGYERYLEEMSRKQHRNAEETEEWRKILEWLKEEAKNYNSLGEWLQAQTEYRESIQHSDGGGTETVRLMTVHASKGLEFDTVYIPDCNEKTYPHGSMPDNAECEEERRIFYVAMTRARKSLELLYLTGTKERPRLPSRFLNPLIKNK